MTKFYLAGKYTAKDRLRQFRDMIIERTGWTCTSRWLDHNLVEAEVDEQGLIEEARKDVEDVLDCDIFILDTEDVSETGGREVELGIASGFADIIVVGPIRNIFHRLADEHYENDLHFITVLEGK